MNKLQQILLFRKGRKYQKLHGVSNEDIVEILQRAKMRYEEEPCRGGICGCIRTSIPYGWIDLKTFRKLVPLFCSEFFTGKENLESRFWWDLEDVDSRIEAFNKLITLYSADTVTFKIGIFTFKFKKL